MTQSHTPVLDVPVLDALLLVAGRGVRFGGDKLLADLKGEPLASWALWTALAAPVRRVFAAVGDDPRLILVLEKAAARRDARDRLVLVPVVNADEGMGVSLRTAAAALPADTRGVFVFLGDMPAIARATPARLAAALEKSDGIVVPVHAGRRGHPVLFGGDWRAALQRLTGDEGARMLLAEAGSRLVTVEVDDPGVLLDVDRPEDLARLPRPIGASAPDR
jgi:molybdenum cofactor cytidylyltransferase